jgi:PAS domain S-box-containing protein
MGTGRSGIDAATFRTIIENSMDAFLLIDSEGLLLDTNYTYERISGYSRRELLGMRIQDLEAQESDSEVREHIRLIRTIGEERFETKHKRKDGVIIEVENSVRYLPAGGGKFIVFLRDVTEKNREARSRQEDAYFFERSQKAALIGSYRTDFTTGRWYSSDVLDLIFGIGKEYDRSIAGWLDLVYEEDRAEMERYLRDDVIGRKEKFHKEYRIARDSDKIVRWVLGLGDITFASSGKPMTLFGTIQDITERKNLERGLAEQSELLKMVVNTMPDLVWLQDSNGVFRFCNNKTEQLFGLPESQILGKTDYDLWGHEKAVHTFAENRSVMAGGKTVRIEEEFVFAHDGHFETVESAKTPVYGANGELAGLLGIARDITQRKRAETALTKQTAQLRTLVDALPDLVWMKNPDGVFVMCNRAFAEFYGRSESEILGKTDYDLSERKMADSFVQGDRIAIQSEKSVTFEEEVVFPDGSREFMETTKAAVRDNDGRALGTIGIGRDIRQRKAGEAQRARLLAELQQSQKMESLGTLAGGIAHDMNNVLAAILAQASVGTTLAPPDSRIFKTFSTIAKASARGGKMVKNILSFARRSPARTDEVDINALIHEEAALLEHTAPSGIHVGLDLEPALQKVRGDADGIGGAIMNLCVNSVQAMSDSGTLTLRTRNRGNMVEVLVADTGVGMTKDVLEKAVEPFFTTKPVGQGTGLGLATVHALVKAHGGKMEITSEVAKGTTVSLLFPKSHDDAVDTADVNTEVELGADARELHVLVVDDDELVRLALNESIEALGHHVTLADRGEQTVPLLESGLEPDVVVLDLNMPGWGGSETLRRIRSLNPDLPVILSTGRLDQTAVDLAAMNNGVSLLAKPYTLEELGRQLRRVVASRRKPVS